MTRTIAPVIVIIVGKQRKWKMKKFYTAKDLKEKMQKALDELQIVADPQVAVTFNKNELHDTIDILNRVESIQCPHCFKWLFDGRKYHAMHYCSACGAVLINVWTEGEEDEQTDT